jgi:hypothetical protein
VLKKLTLVMLLTVLAVIVVACNSAPSETPVSGVENYLKAMTAADEAALLTRTCKAQEGDVSGVADSMRSMNATIEGLSCRDAGTDGDYTIVACTGNLITNYAGETTRRDLGARWFRMIQEDGAWKMCGYAAAR